MSFLGEDNLRSFRFNLLNCSGLVEYRKGYMSEEQSDCLKWTDLHEEPLFPQSLIEDQYVLVGLHHSRIKVHHTQAFQTPSPWQSNISLAALKHTCQRDLHAIQSHALNTPNKSRHQQFYFNLAIWERKKGLIFEYARNAMFLVLEPSFMTYNQENNQDTKAKFSLCKKFPKNIFL